MNTKAFEKAKKTYSYDNRYKAVAGLLALRQDFVAYFTEEKIHDMKIDEYVIGKGIKDWHNFCYAIERTFGELGCILGATSRKFGVFYSPSKQEYVFSAKFGETKIKAFNKVKRSILALLESGRNGDLRGIADNPLSSMVKGKILSLYFPETYLNVFSDSHLDYFLDKFDLASDELLASKAVYKRQALVDFKNNDPDMKSWPMDMFSNFLYVAYPKSPSSEENDEEDDTQDVLNDSTITYTVSEKTIEMERTHKQIQNALVKILKDEYVKLYLEKTDADMVGQMVDMKGIHKKTDVWHYFEIKVADARHSIREAFGQIMEYTHYSASKRRAEKMYIIGTEAPDDKDIAYLKMLRDLYKNIPVHYRWYSLKDNKLSIEY